MTEPMLIALSSCSFVYVTGIVVWVTHMIRSMPKLDEEEGSDE